MVRTENEGGNSRRECLAFLATLAAGCGAVLEDPTPDEAEPPLMLSPAEQAVIHAMRRGDWRALITIGLDHVPDSVPS